MRKDPKTVILVGMLSIIGIIGWELWQDLFVNPPDFSYIRARLIGYLLLMSPLVTFIIFVPIIKLIKHFRGEHNKKVGTENK